LHAGKSAYDSLKRRVILREACLLVGQYESRTLMQLADVLGDVCRTLEAEKGRPVGAETKDLLARRIMTSFESGMADFEKLRADALAIVAQAS
jgi:hypothetical protein